MQTDDDDEYVTLVEAARTVGISPVTLDRWAQLGRIPNIVTADGRRLLLKAALVEITFDMDDPPPPET